MLHNKYVLWLQTQKHKNIMFTIQSKPVLLYVAKKLLYEEIPNKPTTESIPIIFMESNNVN